MSQANSGFIQLKGPFNKNENLLASINTVTGHINRLEIFGEKGNDFTLKYRDTGEKLYTFSLDENRKLIFEDVDIIYLSIQNGNTDRMTIDFILKE